MSETKWYAKPVVIASEAWQSRRMAKLKAWKSVSILVALALVLSLGIVAVPMAGTVEAATINVPGDYGTIQAAINAASAGDTIIVTEGTYNENIVINKGIILQAGSHPIIDGDTTGDGVPDGSCITINVDGVTIDGFDIRNGYNGIIGETDNSIISNNKIHHHLNYVGSNGVGILLWGDNDNNQILGNKIEKNDRQGIFIGYDDFDGNPSTTPKISSGNIISGNDIKKNGLYTQPNGPDASAYGIQLWNADGNTIENNKIRDHEDYFPYGGTTFDFAQGIYLCAAFNNIVEGNDLHKNNYGVGAWSTGRTPVVGSNQIHYNNIHGNTGYGVRNFDSVTLHAEFNYWGEGKHKGAPSDDVSGDVDFDPWLGKEPKLGKKMTYVTQDEVSGIQDAVDEASDGDKIEVCPGEYYGAIVNKSVEIKGTKPKKGEEGTVINDGPPYGSGPMKFGFKLYYAACSGTKISGFTFEDLEFPIFAYLADDITIENNTIVMSLQAITNWHGSGWKIKKNEIDGLYASGGGGIGIFIGCFAGTPSANGNIVEGNSIKAHFATPPLTYSVGGLTLYSDHRWGSLGGVMTDNVFKKNKVEVTGTPNTNACELTDQSAGVNEVVGNTFEKNDLTGSTVPWEFNPEEVVDNNFFEKNKPQPACASPNTRKPYGP